MELPKRLPTLEEFLRVDEIGDRVLIPNIISKKIDKPNSELTIEVDGENYIVSIKATFDWDKTDTKNKILRLAVKIDFAHEKVHNQMTNFNNTLKVVGSVVGSVKWLFNNKEWIDKMAEFAAGDKATAGIEVATVVIGAKTEFEGDNRRAKIYNEYARRIISTLGGNIKKQESSSKVETSPEMVDVQVLYNKFHLEPGIVIREKVSESFIDPYQDEHGKTIVYDDGDYMIAVDDPKAATYITLWNNGKKVGTVETKNYGDSRAKGYLGIGAVDIDKSHRGKGMASNMYSALMKYMDKKYKGLVSYLPDLVSSNMKNWYEKRGAKIVDGDWMILNK